MALCMHAQWSQPAHAIDMWGQRMPSTCGVSTCFSPASTCHMVATCGRMGEVWARSTGTGRPAAADASCATPSNACSKPSIACQQPAAAELAVLVHSRSDGALLPCCHLQAPRR